MKIYVVPWPHYDPWWEFEPEVTKDCPRTVLETLKVLAICSPSYQDGGIFFGEEKR